MRIIPITDPSVPAALRAEAEAHGETTVIVDDSQPFFTGPGWDWMNKIDGALYDLEWEATRKAFRELRGDA